MFQKWQIKEHASLSSIPDSVLCHAECSLNHLEKYGIMIKISTAMDNIDNIIIKIKTHLKNAEESQKKEPLSAADIKKLEKEIDKLIDLLKHYNTTRWTLTSFFMTISFGI